MKERRAKKRNFLSLKWKAALFLAPIVIISEFFLIGIQYKDLNERLEYEKDQLQNIRRDYLNSKINLTNEALIESANKIIDSIYEENGDRIRSFDDFTPLFNKRWEYFLSEYSINSMTLVNTNNLSVEKWGSFKSPPIEEWSNFVVEKEVPLTTIYCDVSCEFYAVTPVLVDKKLGGVFIISLSLIDFVIDFNASTGDDIGIVTVRHKKLKASQSNAIKRWNGIINALTNKVKMFPVIDDLSKKKSLSNIVNKGHLLIKDVYAYSIFSIPISITKVKETYLLIISDVSSDFQHIQLNIRKMIYWTILSSIVVIVLLLLFLWKPIAYLQKQANILPLLAKSEYEKFRKNLTYDRIKIDPFNDELDMLDNISLDLSNQLERLEAEVKARAHELEQFGLHDTLTGLPNRRHLIARLKHALLLTKRNKTKLAVMFMDIDHFKRINDSLGHESGDALLIEVSRRLEKCIRKSDTVARLGGDEFTIIVNDLSRDLDATHIAATIIDSIRQPIKIGAHDLRVTTSIGIAIAPDNGEDAESLLRFADLAMYKSKGLGRDNYHFYTPSMHLAAQSRMELESELRLALDNDEFLIHLQAQIDLKTSTPCGFESLVRWKHPRRGLVRPDQFIPILEDTGLIVPVGEFILRESCKFLKQWIERGNHPIKIAVNISPRQFQDRSFCSRAKEIISETGVPSELVEFEITESLLMEDVESTLESLIELRNFGITLAIDDFGTGYSSLGYLCKFPVQYVKIDREFVKGLPENYNNAAITSAVIAMAHQLKILVVAEGVETEEQEAFLNEHHCNIGQGFFYAKPLEAMEVLNTFTNGILPQHQAEQDTTPQHTSQSGS